MDLAWRGVGDGDFDHRRVKGSQVIGPTGTVRVMVATKPVDFRKGAEGLAALVRDVMQADPFNGAIYVFRAKRADRVKMVFWDGTGVCLFSKLLEDGQFRWPTIENEVMRLSAAQLSALIEGLDWRRVGAARERRRQLCPVELRRIKSGLQKSSQSGRKYGLFDPCRRPSTRFPTIPKRSRRC